MKKSTLRSRISTSLVLVSTLTLGLSAVACSNSSGSPAGEGAGGEGGAMSAGGSSGAGGSVGNGGAAGSPGAGGTSSGASGSGYAGSNNNSDSCIPETLTVPSNVPAIIQTPRGATLIHHFHAAGAQDYKCTATGHAGDAGDAGTTYAWLFVAPEATLLNNCGNHVGTHYAGPGGGATPRWQYTADGSFVQGVKVQASPVAGAIPELLLAATQTTAGAFADVTYVQRLATVGGAAPGAADCTAANVDEVRRSGYSAEYYFYTGGADGGTH